VTVVTTFGTVAATRPVEAVLAALVESALVATTVKV
jgi:hypothetical protein